MTKTCDHCHGPIPPERAKHPQTRFCTDLCRFAYRRENNLPGEVASVHQLKNRLWSVTTHFHDRPPVNRGDRVRIENTPSTRAHAETQENGG